MKAQELRDKLRAMKCGEIMILERTFENGAHALLSFKRMNDPEETAQDAWIFWTWGVRLEFDSCFIGVHDDELCLCDHRVGNDHIAEILTNEFNFYCEG